MKLALVLDSASEQLFHHNAVVVELISENLRRKVQVLALLGAHLDRVLATRLLVDDLLETEDFASAQDREHNLR